MKTDSAPVESDTIDTSKLSPGERAALEITEAAREAASDRGFAAGLFMGHYDLDSVAPFPAQSHEDRDQGDAFLTRLETFLRNETDPDEIDRTGEIPEEVIHGLAQLGAFGIKIPTRFGGLGLSQTNYCRAAMLLGSWCGNLTALLSAHQSIGVPQPLLLFGNEEQRRKYLPRVARGEISAFALTEPGAGSDPARMTTHAEPNADGSSFILNGEKLWCTNGTKAGVIVVMARTPPKLVNGHAKEQISAFIVEMDMPGVEVVHRCRFMGLKALYNAVLRFNNVRVPRENLLLAEGKGLRVALTTLNTGRLTLPAACTGLAKRCLEISREWACEREQWGSPIGRHAAIAEKLAHMAADTFAMESMTLFAASLVDRNKQTDVRLEAAFCKMWATEATWRIVNDTMQIRGGRGYETAQSLRARGEPGIPVERFLRDCRINTIFEGSSEIMRLFIAREALDPHLKIGAPALDSRLSASIRFKAATRATLFYAAWYPRQWIPSLSSGHEFHPTLAAHLKAASRAARHLARTLFHAIVRFGPGLQHRQLLLGQCVVIGAELFAIGTTCARAQNLINEGNRSALTLADYFCRNARLRIRGAFENLRHNTDNEGYRLAQELLADRYNWLNDGIVGAAQRKPNAFRSQPNAFASPTTALRLRNNCTSAEGQLHFG
ncbi:MAG TPA: acyl-CoA dehydrogenase family protein [Chthoniobacterales bacterium]